MPKKFIIITIIIIAFIAISVLSFWKYTQALSKKENAPIEEIDNREYFSNFLIDLAKTPQETYFFNEPETDYRYEGLDVDNYLSFNNELWRIIGLFDESTHGISGEFLVKIMRDEAISYKKWDGKKNPEYNNLDWGVNNWMTSDLNKYLNGEYYNSINENARKMIEKVIWKLGGVSKQLVTVYEFYNAERDEIIFGNNAKEISANVGLIYPSDYGFSLRPTLCTRDSDLKKFHLNGCHDHSWIASDKMNQWLLSPLLDNSINAWAIGHCGDVAHGSASNIFSLRPALYLKQKVRIVSGSGTKADPYLVSI